MPVLPTSPTPLFPVQPNRTEQFPKPEGSAVFGKPFLTFPEAKPSEPKKQASDTTRSPFEDLLDGQLKDLLKPLNDDSKVLLGPRNPENSLPLGNRGVGQLFDTTA